MTASTLTPDQRRAVQAPGSVAVTAGAGTGKTHMLAERYVHHVRADGFGPLEIVAATFTDRAAAELRSRIRARLRGLEASADQAAELEAAQIGTLHALAGRICREHPEAAGVPYDFVLLDPIEQRLWRARHFADAVDALPPDVAPGVPFGIVKDALSALLDDPYTAEAALRIGSDAWPRLIDEERRRVFRDLARRDAWREAAATLRAHAGPDDDKMELQRAAAVAALGEMEAGRFPRDACNALDGLNAGRGSTKAWDGAALRDLKDACKTLRDLYREGAYAFELRLDAPDDTLARALDGVCAAFRSIRAHLDARKREQRVLDFNDLELHALRALEDPQVRAFYRRRWRAFLVDEFQDTNPVQAALLERLTEGAVLTVVGDEKQSVYGFRRADVRVFRAVRDAIRADGGEALELARSFRTHAALVACTNAVVRPVLADLHQPLEAARAEPPGDGPHLRVCVIEADGGELKPFRARAEAHRIGEIVERELLAAGVEVYDRDVQGTRPVRPGDIAILARKWDDLEPLGVELAARGIPTVHAGGGDLFGQREAKDALALLRFLADPADDVSLVAVLRSPFFAVSDADLVHLSKRVGRAKFARGARRGGEGRATPADVPWWDVLHELADPSGPEAREGAASEAAASGAAAPEGSALGSSAPGASSPGSAAETPLFPPAAGSLRFAATVLHALLDDARTLLPSALLARADALTAYTASIANLPGGPRRLADWRGFAELAATLERGHGHLFAVVRQLVELAGLEASAVPRPPLESGDAVSLTTIHNAKGLEWPVVILPDLTARPGGGGGGGPLFDAEAGVAFKVRDEAGELVEPCLYRILKARAKTRDEDEEMRVLYVALTRARDRLFLTANASAGGKLERIRDGLRDAGVEPEPTPFDAAHAVPRTPLPVPLDRRGELRLEPPRPGVKHLDVTALTAWDVCPRQFAFAVRDGHPGAQVRPEVAAWLRERGDADESLVAGASADDAGAIAVDAGRRVAARIGDLTHVALERDIVSVEELAAYAGALPREHVASALELADAFRTADVFAPVRGERQTGREVHVSCRLEGITLHGVADAVGKDFVLDYKTGRPEPGDAHHLQVAVYAAARRVGAAHIAYLRSPRDGGPRLETLGPAQLAAALDRARTAVAGIRDGVLEPTPDVARCASCAFEAICDRSAWRG